MTKIEALCPQCGTKTVLTPDTMVLWEDGDDRSYAFVCVTCIDVTVRRADATAAAMLTAAGVDWWEPLRRAPHPESPPEGTPFTPDDLLAFHELLAGDRWFESLVDC